MHPECASVADWVLVSASEKHCFVRVMRQQVETCSRYRYVDDEVDDDELDVNIDGLSVRDFAVAPSPRMARDIGSSATT